MSELTKKTPVELATLITEAREAIRLERFKTAHSRKASIITSNKKVVAQALTELNARRRLATK